MHHLDGALSHLPRIVAQHSVQPIPGKVCRGWRGGIPGIFRQFVWLEVDSGKVVLSRPPAPHQGAVATGSASRSSGYFPEIDLRVNLLERHGVSLAPTESQRHSSRDTGAGAVVRREQPSRRLVTMPGDTLGEPLHH